METKRITKRAGEVFDYTLQVWTRAGVVLPCSHPASMGPECCNGRRYAGDSAREVARMLRDSEALYQAAAGPLARKLRASLATRPFPVA